MLDAAVVCHILASIETPRSRPRDSVELRMSTDLPAEETPARGDGVGRPAVVQGEAEETGGASEGQKPTRALGVVALFDRIVNDAVGLGLLCYVLGFAVNGLFLAQFGIVDVEVLRTRYILAGAAFLAFVTLIFQGISWGWSSGNLVGTGASVVPLLSAVFWTAVAIVAPYFVVLPSLLAFEPSPWTNRWRPTKPWDTFLLPFLLAWLVPFAIFLLLRLVLDLGQELAARSQGPKEDNDPSADGAPGAIQRSRRYVERKVEKAAWRSFREGWLDSPKKRVAVVAVGTAALVLYSESVFSLIPQQLGGGQAVRLAHVEAQNTSLVENEATPGTPPVQREYNLIARTEDALIIRAVDVNRPTPTVVVVEVAPGWVEEITYPDASSHLFSEMYHRDTASFGFRLTERKADSAVQTILPEADLAAGKFCITVEKRDKDLDENDAKKVCDQNPDGSEATDMDTNPDPGFVRIDGLDPVPYTATVSTSHPCLSPPSAPTIVPDPDVFYEAGLIFTRSEEPCGAATAEASPGTAASD
jgi:hypothetical protein